MPSRLRLFGALALLLTACAPRDVTLHTAANTHTADTYAARYVELPNLGDEVDARHVARVWLDAVTYQHAAERHVARSKARRYGKVAGNGHCGPAYSLPPCGVMMRESGGDPGAYNPTGCGGRGCNGKWQCDPRTCSGTGTEEEQDEEARELWDDGRGCAHWSACP